MRIKTRMFDFETKTASTDDLEKAKTALEQQRIEIIASIEDAKLNYRENGISAGKTWLVSANRARRQKGLYISEIQKELSSRKKKGATPMQSDPDVRRMKEQYRQERNRGINERFTRIAEEVLDRKVFEQIMFLAKQGLGD